MNENFFSKVLFEEHSQCGKRKRIIHLDLVQRELSYQVIEQIRNMPAISKTMNFECEGKIYEFDDGVPAVIMRNGKNDFQNNLLPSDYFDEKVIFSYGIKLNEDQMKSIWPLCKVNDFEPYRNRKMSMDDLGYIGYRDEISLTFTGVSNLYIPLITLPMVYFYDADYIWPSEKLYKYILTTYLQGNKKLKEFPISYGESSIFW